MLIQTWEQVRVETHDRRARLTRAWGRTRRRSTSVLAAAPGPAVLPLDDRRTPAEDPSVRRAAA